MTNGYLHNIDVNTMYYSGFYLLGQGCTNLPSDDYRFEWISLYVAGNGNGGTISQIIISRTTDVFVRQNTSSTWSPWYQIQNICDVISELIFINDSTSNYFKLSIPPNHTRYCCRMLVCNQGDTSGAGFVGDYFIGVNNYGILVAEISQIQGAANMTITRDSTDPNLVIASFDQHAIWAYAILTGARAYIT